MGDDELTRALNNAAKALGIRVYMKPDMSTYSGMTEQARIIEEIARRLVALEKSGV